MSKQVKEQELDETETELSEDLDLNDEELNLEDDSDNGVPTSKDETKTEPEGKKAEPKPEAKAKPDELAKAEQMVQQERANARKAREQAERLEQNQTHLSQQWEAAQKELAELKAAIVAKKEERKALDPETATSAQLIGEIEGLHGQLADQKKRADKLESDLTRAEKAREEALKQFEENTRLKIDNAQKASEAKVAEMEQEKSSDEEINKTRGNFVDEKAKLEEELALDIQKIKELHVKELLTENQFHDLKQKYGHIFESEMGAGAILQIIKAINLD